VTGFWWPHGEGAQFLPWIISVVAKRSAQRRPSPHSVSWHVTFKCCLFSRGLCPWVLCIQQVNCRGAVPLLARGYFVVVGTTVPHSASFSALRAQGISSACDVMLWNLVHLASPTAGSTGVVLPGLQTQLRLGPPGR
jgi:hypothetical protein